MGKVMSMEMRRLALELAKEAVKETESKDAALVVSKNFKLKEKRTTVDMEEPEFSKLTTVTEIGYNPEDVEKSYYQLVKYIKYMLKNNIDVYLLTDDEFYFYLLKNDRELLDKIYFNVDNSTRYKTMSKIRDVLFKITEDKKRFLGFCLNIYELSRDDNGLYLSNDIFEEIENKYYKDYPVLSTEYIGLYPYEKYKKKELIELLRLKYDEPNEFKILRSEDFIE